MKPTAVKKFIERERRRAQFYAMLSVGAEAIFILVASLASMRLSQHFLFLFKLPESLQRVTPFVFLIAGLGFLVFVIRRSYIYLGRISFVEIARAIENQSKFFEIKSDHRSEFVSVASFLSRKESEWSEFESAHIQSWARRLPQISIALRPARGLFVRMIIVGISIATLAALREPLGYRFPNRVQAWSPSGFEIRLPFAGAEWSQENGALSGISGAEVRFKAPDFSPLKTFLFIREVEEERWVMKECQENCELKLRVRGQYAVGSLFSRSPIFPLLVSPDEPPKGTILAKVNGEWASASTIEVLNKKQIDLQLSSSDDIRLKKVELIHRFQDETDTLATWDLTDAHFKMEYVLSMEGWKGGAHDILLKMSDELQSANSASLTILYADDETLKEKRAQSLRALLDEWVHVLGDLLESDHDQNLKEGLVTRLGHIDYPQMEDQSLINAYVKELQILGQKIDRWARLSPQMSEVKPLIERTEKSILYGLSLLFQEKTGDIESTADHLKNSQADLNKLLQEMKDGKIEFGSKELEEAFQKMTKQLEELQKKIRELPQGPQDELLNREALEQQAEESQSLADKIEEIKKQMASGDSKGAMRELESLLNQLSILSKEMERTLDQWKSNLDQGALQSQEKFTKKLEELKKRQENLAQKTDKIKEKSEKLEAESQKTWKPVDSDKQKQIAKEFKNLEGEQERLTKDFQQLKQDFDQSLEGSEWQEVFRNSESEEMEKNISERMVESKEGLAEQKAFDSLSNQKEAIELMNRLGEGQQKLRKQAESAQTSPQNSNRNEKIEIKSTDKQLNAERKRKIMESLRQKVDDRFQKSHEHYFEELLQR